MSRVTRRALAAVAAVFLLGVLVLLFRGPTFSTSNYSGPSVTVNCGALITVGWPSDPSYLNDEGFSVWGDTVQNGPESLPSGARAGFARDCSERRDTYLALALLLGSAGTVLASAAIAAPRPAGPQLPAGSSERDR